jgi:cytochrome P450
MSPYILHRDVRFWPDPDQFDPDRFAPERKGSIQKFAYIPFSFGPRGCIGEQFAWTEGILLLATLAQRWRFRPTKGRPPQVRPVITLRPDRSIPVRVERRRPG